MTFIEYKQNPKAKESKQNDLYSLFAIFLVPLQQKYIYGSNRKERTHGYTFADW